MTQLATSKPQKTTAQPPHDAVAEKHLLGSILMRNDLLDQVVDVVRAEDFYAPQHRPIYKAMLALSDRSEAIDTITLANELRAQELLAQAGGEQYLEVLSLHVGADANVEQYAKIIRDKALLRNIASVALQTYHAAMGHQGDAQAFADKAGEELLEAVSQHTPSDFVPVSELARPVFAELEQLYERQNPVTGLPSGLTRLDEITTGWQRGDLIIIGGRPSMGKTACVTGMAIHVAQHCGLPVALFSQEMNNRSMTKRLLSSDARVDLKKLRNGQFVDTDWPKIARASDRLFKNTPIYLHQGAVSAMTIRSKCRKLKARLKQLGLVVIDYLQLMEGSGNENGGQNREQEIAKISRSLKHLAEELDCPVIALSQLNRSLEKRENKRPVMSDLRESGQVEQDADVIAFVYRDEVYNPKTDDKGIAEIIIAKQRNGELATARVAFQAEYARFEDLPEDREPPQAANWG